MKNYYQHDLETTEEDFVSQLTIAVSKEGEFIFGCDWEPNETGRRAMASIFYGIAHEQLSEQILDQLKSQCVLEDREDDFLAIIQFIGSLINKDDNLKGGSDQSIAVPPRSVFKM